MFSVTGLAKRFQAPVIIGQRGDKTRYKHERDHPPGQHSPTREHNIGDIHCSFHRNHRNERHTNRRFKGNFQRHLSGQDNGFKHNRRHQTIKDRQAHNRPDRPINIHELEIGNGA